MDKNKLVLAISILLGCIILGGFYYASEVDKQRSIERQQQIEIEQKRQELLTKETKEQEEKEGRQIALDNCLGGAVDVYSRTWESECEERNLGEDCSLPKWLSDSLKDSMDRMKDDCFKRYPAQ